MADASWAVVLAAGLGTRMHSPLSKVLHPLLGRPMVEWVVRALPVPPERVIVVVHHQEEAVRAALAHLGVRFARQEAPRGTGDAVAAALPLLPAEGKVLIAAGDTPLLDRATLARALAQATTPATVLSMRLDDPRGYGRIVRDASGPRIVEQGDCTPEQDEIQEVNSGAYVFSAAYLHAQLPQLQPHPPKGELYLTDLFGPPLAPSERAVVAGGAPAAFLGVNDRGALAEARGVLRRRVNRSLGVSGVDLADLDSITVEASATVHPGAVLGPGVTISGESVVAGEVGANCVLHNTVVEAGAKLLPGSQCEGAIVRAGAIVGPMARLRPGAVIERGAHIGNFVEVKNARVHEGAKANHLSYIGDAEVGPKANVGAGTITCNYDGFAKHRTWIGAGAFIGSNTSLVAPVSVGDGAIIGAGTTVSEDVPNDAIAVGRPSLQIREGGAERLRAKKRALQVKKP